MLRLRLLGTFLRMLDAEFAAGNLTPAIREQRRLLTERFDLWYGQAEADSPGPPIEIRKLVAVQLGAALIAASHVTGQRQPTGFSQALSGTDRGRHPV
jgi:hypothetical protein